MDDEKCYVYTPSTAANSQSNGTAKHAALHSRSSSRPAPDATWPARKHVFATLWQRQEQALLRVVADAAEATYAEILAFLRAAAWARMQSPGVVVELGQRCMSAGYVLAGPDTSSHAVLFETLVARLAGQQAETEHGQQQQQRLAMVTVRASEGPNLKTLLKVLIRRVLDSANGDERGSERLLDYDLQAVRLWMREQEVDALVIGVVDSEAFQASVLADFVDLLSSWQDRIPVTILFGIATSIEIFQERLPRATLLLYEATQFDVVRMDDLVERMFEVLVKKEHDEMAIRLGPQLLGSIITRQRQNIQSSQDFINAVQYSYMSHFYANRLTVFLGDVSRVETEKEELLASIRCLPSFQSFIEDAISNQEFDLAESLLSSDDTLIQFVQDSVHKVLRSLNDMTDAIQLLYTVLQNLQSAQQTTPFSSSLYLTLFGQAGRDSLPVRECLLSLKKAPSDTMTLILTAISSHAASEHLEQLNTLRLALDTLLASTSSTTALKSRHATSTNGTLRTTVVAHKVELSRHTASISAHDAAYSDLVEQIHDALAAYFAQTLVPLATVPLHELLLYDGRAPDKAVFMPRHRYVVERALAAPHDYLDCECCRSTAGDGVSGATLARTQPCTALLYQLYTESGALINAADLWTAFNGVLSEDGEEDDARNMFLFQRALAELRYLGFVRSTKRKTDHLVKVSWKGL